MRYERRRSKRVMVEIKTLWEGDRGQYQGVINDISLHGCYMLTGGETYEKELVMVEIPYPNGKEILRVWGTITNYLPEIGFGVEFTSLSDGDRVIIQRVIEKETRAEKKK